MKLTYKLLIALSTMLMTQASCKKEDQKGADTTSNNKISATVNGVSFTSVTATACRCTDPGHGYYFSISSKNSAGHRINLGISGWAGGTGEYLMGGADHGLALYDPGTGESLATSGKITITKLEDIPMNGSPGGSYLVTGTFNFVTTDDFVTHKPNTITAGTFTVTVAF